MSGKHLQLGRSPIARTLGMLVLLFVPLGRMQGGDGGASVGDPCEIHARQAYWQALKFCQLADNANPNPRLRCYDAAKSVYFQTLDECHKSQASSMSPNTEEGRPGRWRR